MARWRVDYLGKNGSHRGPVEALTKREGWTKRQGSSTSHLPGAGRWRRSRNRGG